MITDVERKDALLFLKTKEGMLRLQPLSERSVRVTYTERSAFSRFMLLSLKQDIQESIIQIVSSAVIQMRILGQ